ncbi:hypothetical protein [Shewanella sp.]
MIIEWFSWGSPVGIGIFIACIGIFFWGMFTGVARLQKSKLAAEAEK